jgi:GNAT superfamily N-acetyltransferase
MAVEDLARQTRIVEDAWCAAWSSLGALDASPRTRVDDTPDCLRVYTPGLPESLLNIVLRYRGPTPVTPAVIERIIAPYRSHHLPFQWWINAGDEAPGLRVCLRLLGMQTWGGATAMTLDLAGWHVPASAGGALPDGLHLACVTSERDGRDALGVICEVFYVPAGPMARWTTENSAFQVYLARLGGRAVSALAIQRVGGVAGVYHVATRPGARRRGIAGALLALALDEARAGGCTLAALTATPEARRLYESLGFRACGAIEQWAAGRQLSHTLLYGDRSSSLYSPWD